MRGLFLLCIGLAGCSRGTTATSGAPSASGWNEKDQAAARGAIAQTSSETSAAGLHGRRLTVPPRLVVADKKQTLAFTMGANDITFDITSAKVDELLSNAVAVGEMANDSQEERAQWYPDVRVLSVMFPASALAAHALQSIARGYGGGWPDLRVFAVSEAPEQVLHAFDVEGTQAVRSACGNGARAWATEAVEKPGWSYRRASVALPSSCTDERSDLHLYVRRFADTTLVLACRTDDYCGEIARSVHVGPHR